MKIIFIYKNYGSHCLSTRNRPVSSAEDEGPLQGSKHNKF